MIDTHIHLEQYEQVESLIPSWQERGIEKVVAVSNDLRSSYKTLELKERFPDFIWAAVGFHPEYEEPVERDVEEWKQLVKQELSLISAIGEIGLPHYSKWSSPSHLPRYIERLKEYIDVAHTYSLPVVLHAVHDKAELVYMILSEEFPEVQAHFHWLKGSEEVVHSIVRAGHYISVTPEVCYRKRDERLTVLVPPAQLLIETDGPWPFQGPFLHKQTTPLFLQQVTQKVASIHRMTEAQMKRILRSNAYHLYGRTES
ncbi:TatD family hydrolase [Aliibacillus thermotolerans]|uniref:TatD family hydrolase n=1 Tax=Aliibacillus thermotolerans TaxID=1834418 RepID=A0ABW0U589_9BACI|nr:TatD family hydrolase [Aliibacillus thermotolerans]MDA3129109.1 TatD family deoxyribonuclease [Aliibacillus thermotolerans]